MISGQQITISVGSKTARGKVIFGSDNHKSLIVEAESGLLFSDGLYAGAIPLLMDDTGEYRDLVTGTQVVLDWEQSE